MSDSIIIEIQRAATDSSQSLVDLLRKCLLVARKLGLADFQRWVECELHGYSIGKDVPEHRRIQGAVKAWNPYHGWIPVILGDSGFTDTVSVVQLGSSVSELEALLKSPEGTIQIPFSPEELELLRKGLDTHLVPTRLFGKPQIAGVLDSVRSRILDWAITLEAEGVLGEGLSFSRDETEKAQSVVQNIRNSIVGDVHGAQIQFGNYNTIHAKLKECGIAQADRNELENIVDELGGATGNKRKGALKRGLEWTVKHADKLGSLSETVRSWFTGG